MRNFYKPVWSIIVDPCITGDYLYELPMMHCESCGHSRGNVGIHYPWIDVSTIFPADKLRMIDNTKRSLDCSWEEFRYYQATLRSHVSLDYPLSPSTGFGFLHGKVYKRPKDFEMPDFATLVARRSAVAKLAADGFALANYEVVFKKKTATEDHVNLFAPPVGIARNLGYCPKCERGIKDEEPVIDLSTIPEGLHFFRLKNEASIIMFSEELVKAIRAHKFTGLEFLRVACE